LYINNHEEEL
jgi:hypothetical protein